MNEPRQVRFPVRTSWRVAAALTMVGLLALTTACVRVESDDGAFRVGGSVVVDKDEVAHDDIVVVGGRVRVDGEARGDVVVIGGSLEVNGRADGLVCIGGSMRIGPDAHVRGDVVNVGGRLRRSPGAQIDGEVVNVGISGLDSVPWLGGAHFGFSPWWGLSPFRVMQRGMQFIYWLLLALLTVALVGDRVSSTAHSIQREPIRFGAIGLVGFFALLLACVFLFVLSILIIGIPFLIALLLLWWLAYIFGMVAVFQVVGGKVLQTLGKRDASQIVIVLSGAGLFGIVHFFPWVGSLLWTVGAFVGLGAVFATRFGTNRPWTGGHAPVTAPTVAPSGMSGSEPAPPADPGQTPPAGSSEGGEPPAGTES